jgi:hypothetical protein
MIHAKFLCDHQRIYRLGVGLVWPFRAALRMKTLIERLSALEASLDRMPVVDLCFAQLPAEQNDLVADLAGKIQQSLIEILYLDANRIDFLDRILGLLDRGPLGHALTRHGRDIHQHPSREEDILAEHLQFRFDQAGTRFAFDRPPQKGFENRQERLRLIQRECLHKYDLRPNLMINHLDLWPLGEAGIMTER